MVDLHKRSFWLIDMCWEFVYLGFVWVSVDWPDHSQSNKYDVRRSVSIPVEVRDWDTFTTTVDKSKITSLRVYEISHENVMALLQHFDELASLTYLE